MEVRACVFFLLSSIYDAVSSAMHLIGPFTVRTCWSPFEPSFLSPRLPLVLVFDRPILHLKVLTRCMNVTVSLLSIHSLPHLIAKNWILRAFQVNEEHRFSAAEALQDPWLQVCVCALCVCA